MKRNEKPPSDSCKDGENKVPLMQNDLSVNKKRMFYFLLAIATKQNISHGVASGTGEGAGWNRTYPLRSGAQV